MYIPRSFEMTDGQVAEVLRAGHLAHLVTPSVAGMQITPLPLMYDETNNSLIGHLARANTHWHHVEPDVESVAIYSGVNGYITPTWYATTAETGKTVPTWNYETVNIHGFLHVHDDPEWLRQQVISLSEQHESPRPRPWRLDDAPAEYVAAQLRGIVGIELTITRWEGKAKMSQNQPERNQQGVIAGLSASPNPIDRLLAESVTRYTTAD